MKSACDMKVSRATGMLIDCLQKLQGVHDDVYKALHVQYAAKDVEEIINNEFWEEYNALEARINKMVMDSIHNNLGNLCTTEI